jgi:hypothetical protein
MNWDAIGAIGEIVGALAVVISIAYLAIQIRSNTRATKASAGFEATHSWAASNEQATQMTDGLLEAMNKSFGPEARQNDFSDIENIRIGAHFRSLFQKLEGQYYLYQYGYLATDLWKKRSSWARGFIQLPYYKNWWENELKEMVYSDEFVDAIHSSSPINVSLPGLGDNKN